MDKKQLRIYYKKLRSFLTEQEKEQKSLAVANRLLTLDIWDKTYFHLFLTIDEMNGINADYIRDIWMRKVKEIIILKSDCEARIMIHYLLKENTEMKENQ